MRSDFVNREALEKLTRELQPDNGLALRVSVETGLRIGDVLALKGENIDGSVISFKAAKTGKTGKKTISARLCKELRGRVRRGEYVFPGRGKTGHLTRQAVYKDLRKQCARLGLEGHISPHSARKAYAVELYHEKGLSVTQKELQHSNVSDTMIYALSDIFSAHKSTISRGDCALNDDAVLDKIAERIAAKLSEIKRRTGKTSENKAKK